ncbi:hypothetical protein RAMDARK_0478 [Rickettsia amblyommatis str. Darkwater]|nr:hypothetical protein RAMDARK_0478 [Rickettsia amblyommatis str. Darkwater]
MSCPQKRESSTLKLYLKSKIYKKNLGLKDFFWKALFILLYPGFPPSRE